MAARSNVNPANAITASRFLSLPVFWWAIQAGHGYAQIGCVAAMYCGLADLFDGAVARKLHCETAFGEVFDAIADGVCYGTMLLILAIYGWVPGLSVGITLVLGVANIGMRWQYARRAGRTVNYKSHAMEKMAGYAAYLVGIGLSGFEVGLFYWAYPTLMVVVMAWDTKRMLFDPIDPPAVAISSAAEAAS